MAESTGKHSMVLYAMLRHTHDAARLRDVLPEHLRWLHGQEKRGVVLLSGPAEPTADSALSGLTVFQIASYGEADALAQQDPAIRSGAMTYALHAWSVREGRVTLRLDLSDHDASFG